MNCGACGRAVYEHHGPKPPYEHRIQGHKFQDKGDIMINLLYDPNSRWLCSTCCTRNSKLVTHLHEFKEQQNNNIETRVQNPVELNSEEITILFDRLPSNDQKIKVLNEVPFQLLVQAISGRMRDHTEDALKTYGARAIPVQNTNNYRKSWLVSIPSSTKEYMYSGKDSRREKRKILDFVANCIKSKPLIVTNNKIDVPNALNISTSRTERDDIRDSFKRSFQIDYGKRIPRELSLLPSEQRIRNFVNDIMKFPFTSGEVKDSKDNVRAFSMVKFQSFASQGHLNLFEFLQYHVNQSNLVLPTQNNKLKKVAVFIGDTGAGCCTLGFSLPCRRDPQSRNSFIPVCILSGGEDYKALSSQPIKQLFVEINNLQKLILQSEQNSSIVSSSSSSISSYSSSSSTSTSISPHPSINYHEILDLLIGGDISYLQTIFGLFESSNATYPSPLCLWENHSFNHNCEARTEGSNIVDFSCKNFPLLEFWLFIDKIVPPFLHIILGIGSYIVAWMKDQATTYGFLDQLNNYLDRNIRSVSLVGTGLAHALGAFNGPELKKLSKQQTYKDILLLIPSTKDPEHWIGLQSFCRSLQINLELLSYLFTTCLSNECLSEEVINQARDSIPPLLKPDMLTELFDKEGPTVKIHILRVHVLEWLDKYGNLGALSESSLESYHGLLKQKLSLYRSHNKNIQKVLENCMKNIIIENDAVVQSVGVPKEDMKPNS